MHEERGMQLGFTTDPFLHPLGPYWYLHTLMLCGIVTYVIAQFASRHRLLMLIGVLLCLWVLALLGLVTWINAVYFCVGVVLRLYHRPFIDTFHPAWWSFIGVILVATCVPNALQRHTIGGMLIVYFVISFLLWLYPYLPKGMAKIALFIGRNSLILLLFSPMFTVLSKLFQSYLLFEPSGMLFMLVALLFTVVGSFTVAYILQKLQVARYVFGKSRIIK